MMSSSFVSLKRVIWLTTDQLKPISSAYARYSPSATFHDPIGLAEGLESIVRYL